MRRPAPRKPIAVRLSNTSFEVSILRHQHRVGVVLSGPRSDSTNPDAKSSHPTHEPIAMPKETSSPPKGNSYDPLHRSDVFLLICYSLLLFGISTVSGRPLTLHECVLPQSARSMFADRDFIVPKIDAKPAGAVASTMPSAPWLESPPLPQWITVAIAIPFGRCDSESIVRIGPVLVGTSVVLMVAWMATLWYGRSLGLLAGLVMATSFQFTRYCWLAEDEIYLCGVITAVAALFVKIEFGATPFTIPTDRGVLHSALSAVFGSRPWIFVAFFITLGATNLVKGLLFGTVVALVPIGGFLLLSADLPRIAKYLWLWGACLFFAVMFAWPLAVYSRCPDVLDLWHCDLYGRLSGRYTVTNEPVWYYAANLPWMLLPWTFIVPFGLWATRLSAWCNRTSPERFLWCWAFLLPVVLSIPGGKHHHYLLHGISPWAILAALGVREFRTVVLTWPRWLTHPATSVFAYGVPAIIALAVIGSQIPGPAWMPLVFAVAVPCVASLCAWAAMDQSAWRSGALTFGVLLCGYAFGHCYAGRYIDSNRHDVAFMRSVRQRVDTERLPLLIDMSANPFHGLMGLFHQKDETRLLHNPSFLAASEVNAPEVLIVAIDSHRDEIAGFGDVEALERSERIPRGMTEKDHLTLFRLHFRENIERVPASNIRISPMQAMCRTKGPFLTVDIAKKGSQPTETVLK